MYADGGDVPHVFCIKSIPIAGLIYLQQQQKMQINHCMCAGLRVFPGTRQIAGLSMGAMGVASELSCGTFEPNSHVHKTLTLAFAPISLDRRFQMQIDSTPRIHIHSNGSLTYPHTIHMYITYHIRENHRKNHLESSSHARITTDETRTHTNQPKKNTHTRIP